jgi:hypothetical protein
MSCLRAAPLDKTPARRLQVRSLRAEDGMTNRHVVHTAKHNM